MPQRQMSNAGRAMSFTAHNTAHNVVAADYLAVMEVANMTIPCSGFKTLRNLILSTRGGNRNLRGHGPIAQVGEVARDALRRSIAVLPPNLKLNRS